MVCWVMSLSHFPIKISSCLCLIIFLKHQPTSENFSKSFSYYFSKYTRETLLCCNAQQRFYFQSHINCEEIFTNISLLKDKLFRNHCIRPPLSFRMNFVRQSCQGNAKEIQERKRKWKRERGKWNFKLNKMKTITTI